MGVGDFSIELAAEQIIDPRTRAYFGEVYSSYTAGNYRSAVVMLWSVVICDLVFKLEDLKSRNDPAALKISAEIENMQKASPRSPEWEERLVDRLNETTHLLDESERVNLATLQKHRHLSAHPVISTATYELFAPNRETVRAHIRNTLEAVLTKPALMSRKIFDAFLEDLVRLADVFPFDSGDDVELGRYLTGHYFDRLAPAVVDKIFRSLWRIVFKSEDPLCEANRAINYRGLRLLYARDMPRLFKQISGEPEWFSETALTGKPLRALVAFLAEEPRVYAVLKDSAKALIGQHVAEDSDQAALAWFLSPSLGEHLKKLREKLPENKHASIDPETFRRLAARAADEKEMPALRDLGVMLYATAWSYDLADKRFQSMIEPHLRELTADQLRTLLVGIEANSQTHGRGRAKDDHPKLKRACDVVLGPSFDFSPFGKFIGSLPTAPPPTSGAT